MNRKGWEYEKAGRGKGGKRKKHEEARVGGIKGRKRKGWKKEKAGRGKDRKMKKQEEKRVGRRRSRKRNV